MEVTVMADQPLRTACVLSVHELLGTAAVHEALASSPPAALLQDH